MDIKKLDQEKFDYLKELADIQENVSLGRATLRDLKATAEKYMVVREKEAEARVLKVLKESRGALDETTKNHDELSKYNSELKAYANELKQSAIDITALFGDFHTRMATAEKEIDEGLTAVNKLLVDIKIERVNIKEDRKMLEAERHRIAEANRLLLDRRDALERAWAELERLKNNK